jgi:hypothetical protein
MKREKQKGVPRRERIRAAGGSIPGGGFGWHSCLPINPHRPGGHLPQIRNIDFACVSKLLLADLGEAGGGGFRRVTSEKEEGKSAPAVAALAARSGLFQKKKSIQRFRVQRIRIQSFRRWERRKHENQ